MRNGTATVLAATALALGPLVVACDQAGDTGTTPGTDLVDPSAPGEPGQGQDGLGEDPFDEEGLDDGAGNGGSGGGGAPGG